MAMQLVPPQVRERRTDIEKRAFTQWALRIADPLYKGLRDDSQQLSRACRPRSLPQRAPSLELLQQHSANANIKGNTIRIDEAHFRIGMIQAYSYTLLSMYPAADSLFLKWAELFTDSVRRGDPVVALDGGDCFGLFNPGLLDEEQQYRFNKHLTAWIGLVMAHEMAHIALGHEAALAKEEKQNGFKGAVALQNKLEDEADSCSIEYLKAANIDPAEALSGLSTWYLIRQPQNYGADPLSMTHPTAIARARTLVT